MAGKSVQSCNVTNVPVLDDNDFEVWKDRMTKYMDSIDERLMTVVLNGPMFPLKVSTTPRVIPPLADVEGAVPEVQLEETLVRKPRNEWTEEDKLTYGLDNKAKYFLTCGINNKTYKHIYRCKTAQEIWIAILQYYEGDQITKDNKLYGAIQEFEAFKKEPNESVREAYDRFCEVCNTCAALGKEYSMKDLNMRFLGSLGSGWHMKITAIKEARDLNTTHIQNLVSSLFLYEKELQKLLQHSDKQLKQIAFPAQETPIITQPSENPLQQIYLEKPSSNDSIHISELKEDAFAAFARTYLKNKFAKRQQPRFQKTTSAPSSSFQKSSTKPSDGKNAQGELVCYNCRKPGHFASKCTKPKFEYLRKKAPKYFQKNKGLVAEEKEEEPLIWLESDSDGEGVENADFAEEADISFMAFISEETDASSLPTPAYISPLSSFQEERYEVSKTPISNFGFTDDFEDPIPDAGNPHGFVVHRYSGNLYGQVGPSTSSSRITRSKDPITPAKSPSKSPNYSPTSFKPKKEAKNPLLPFSNSEDPNTEAYQKLASSKASASSYSQASSTDDFSRDDMALIMNEMFNDFEELKEVHNVLSDNFKSATAENQTLKAEIVVLRCLKEDFSKLKSQNECLNEKLKTSMLMIQDVIQKNKELTATVNRFSKPQAAVQTILETQMTSHDKSGIGFKLEMKTEENDEPKLSKPSDKGKGIAYDYPSERKQVQESNKGKNKLKKDELELKKDYSSAETASTESSSSSDSEKVKAPKASSKVKAKTVKLAPVGFKQDTSRSIEEVNIPEPSSALIFCQICNEDGHMSQGCPLRNLSGTKGAKAPNGSQKWLPKRN